MKRIPVLLLALLMLLHAACADSAIPSPPGLQLAKGETAIPVEKGSWSWTYPTGTPGQWAGVEACGMAPTDPAVFENSEHLLLAGDTEYMLDWEGESPDRIEILGWENSVFQEAEPEGNDPDSYSEITDGAIVLKPDHVYAIHATWLEAGDRGKAYGSATYAVVTERSEDLPAYAYTGTDPLEAAIVNTLLTDGHAGMYLLEPGSVTIPCPILLKTEQTDDLHATVYGCFWILNYVRRGRVLENISGGEVPMMVTLENAGGEWRVTSMEEAGDGEDYAGDIMRFAHGDWVLASQYFDAADLKAHEEIRTKWIREYVEANGLDISAYQDFGWDPVSLYEERSEEK